MSTLPEAPPNPRMCVVEDKKSKSGTANAIGTASPGPVVNPLDEAARETFATGRPLEDSPDLQQCKHCKKSILKTAAKDHIAACLRIKKEKAQRKKEAREAREKAREAAREEEAKRNGDVGDGAAPAADAAADDDSDDDDTPEKSAGKTNAGKTAGKKVGGKKTDGAVSGKKRKAEGDKNDGPKMKKKKDEPKPKVAKPKGECGCPCPEQHVSA